MNQRPSLLTVDAAARPPVVPESVPPVQPTHYHAIDSALVGHNVGGYHNRPLFINNTNAFALAGDRPIVRIGRGQRIYGAWMIALVRGDQAKWLHLGDDITSTYRAGRMSWAIGDSTFAGATVNLEVVPMDGTLGMALRLVAQGCEPGDQLVWAFGSTLNTREGTPFNLTPAKQTQWFVDGFVPEECRGNMVQIGADGRFTLRTSDVPVTVVGKCSAVSTLAVGDATLWRNPLAFAASVAGDLPLACGTTVLRADEPLLWTVEVMSGEPSVESFPVAAADEVFAAGVRRCEALAGRVVASTPEPRLDAWLSCAGAEMDGVWYPPVFVHGTMEWNVPYPGWQMIFGGTVCGWHDRVQAEAAYYIGSQVTESDKTRAKADPGLRLCVQHPESRFYGRGHIVKDQAFYNMQTQFFDQIVYDWRWTADPELEKLLRPALELHLEWARECFDPDGDGLYESYINTWPTDSVWYNGGGAVEETAYAYRGHLAARDLAQRAGDLPAVEFHSRQLAKIKNAFLAKLWIPRRGHAGVYLEQGGHGRLHEDAWLYSICLPIDAGLVTREQAAESLYFTEWGLQNDRTPFGGREVWTSNWVPGVWSVRPRCGLDFLNLALAYFQAGFGEDGWDILQGEVLPACQNPVAVGRSASLILRTVLEGLFGVVADYPNHKVRCAPQLPVDWDHASLRTPDVAVQFERIDNTEVLEIELVRRAALEVVLPVRARRITRVTANGEPVRYEVWPGFGQSLVTVSLPAGLVARIVVTVAGRLPQSGPVYVHGRVGQPITLTMDGPEDRLIDLADPQGALVGATITPVSVTARLAQPALGAIATADGDHVGRQTVIARVQTGDLPQWQLIRLTIADPAAAAAAAATRVEQIPEQSKWQTIDLTMALNADVRTIYQQAYLSPRPNTVSVQIGVDGYSPWTFPFWQTKPPAIRLDAVPTLRKRPGEILTPQGVPFVWPGETRNIAFTSLWDNWPTRVTVPVGAGGEALWLLIGGSTNPMQCHLANAVVTLQYANGEADTLELIPPFNFWSLCPLGAKPGSAEQDENSRPDYNYTTDAFCLPAVPPPTVQLGENCRAMVLNRRLRLGLRLESVTLETLSQDVVVGLMGLTLMNPVEPEFHGPLARLGREIPS